MTQLSIKKPEAGGQKIARVCWNTNGWISPSGLTGKSQSKDSYENENGYGHEEWLLDFSKTIGGFHYSFLEPIWKYYKKYVEKRFDIHLYTIDSSSGNQRYWLGEIRDVHVITPRESLEALTEYKRRGWYADMLDQLRTVGVDPRIFERNSSGETFAIVKFRPEHAKILPEPISFQHSDPAVTSNYYTLLNFTRLPEEVDLKEGFSFRPKTGKLSTDGKKTKVSYSIEKTREEAKLCNALGPLLKRQFGDDQVAQEQPTGFGTRIDFAVRVDGHLYFYEVKIGTNARDAIRKAIGQLLEYGYFGEQKTIKKLIIVSNAVPDRAAKYYIEFLRSHFSLPIYYLRFGKNDLDFGELV